MNERERFEALISGPPFERKLTRWDNSPERAWPGQYREYEVQLAWECWQAAVAWATARERERFAEVINPAVGLCHGYDWNGGHHARLYRAQLLIGVNKLHPIPDFDSKLAAALRAENERA